MKTSASLSCKRIGVVGFSATGLSFLAQFMEKLEEPDQYELFVFDTSPHGLGDAYCPQADSNLMNTSVEVSSLFEDKPDDFLEWLNQNPAVWKKFFSKSEKLSGKELVPRFVFGRYLDSRRGELMEKASLSGLKVTKHSQEIIDLRKNGGRYTLLSASAEFEVDAVLLFTGGFKRPLFPVLRGKPGFIESIYNPTDWQLPREDASVLVLGTKLSAIDALLQLANLLPKAKLAAASRTGEFPAPNLAIDLKRRKSNRWLNREAFDALRAQTGSRPVEDVLYELAKNALRDVGHPWDLDAFLNEKPKERLSRQIENLDAGNAAYEAIILPLAQLLEEVWWDLEEPQRAAIRNKYFRVIMHYVGAFPLENARKIQSLLKDGRIRLFDGLKSVEATARGFKVCFENAPPEEFAVVVDCSGYDNGLTNLEFSPLMRKLSERKIFQLNGCGGFQIDRDYRLIGADGNSSQVFAAGLPIKGSVPFANWFNRIVSATNRIQASLTGKCDANL